MIVKETLLEAIKFKFNTIVGTHALNTIDVELYSKNYGEQIAIMFEIDVLGQHNIHEYECAVKVPKNFWEHFKESYFPPWYNKKFPIKYEIKIGKVSIDHMILFPEIERVFDGSKVCIYSKKL
jgi:UDP-N-acetylglucosamine:LPS N-acetylglucosamine transferase